MRCVACDVALTDREATTKFLYSGKYTDMCRKCLSFISDEAPTEDSPFHANDGEVNVNHDQE